MYNNYFGGNQVGGTNYVKPAVAKMTQALTQEEFNKLKNDSRGDFSFKVEPEEKLVAMCTHKDPQSGQTTLSNNGDGTCTCWICKQTFVLEENQAMVDEVTAKMLDTLQTIKTYYLDIPAEFAREYFQIIPLIERVPKLFKIAANCFQKYENNGLGVNQTGNMNSFGAYAALGGGYGNFGGYPQGQYMQPQGQIQGYDAYGNPVFVQPQGQYVQGQFAQPQGQGNPFVGDNSQGGYYAPQDQGQGNGYYAPQGQGQYVQPQGQGQSGFAPQGGFAPGVSGGGTVPQSSSAPLGAGQQVTTTNTIVTTKTLDI